MPVVDGLECELETKDAIAGSQLSHLVSACSQTSEQL